MKQFLMDVGRRCLLPPQRAAVRLLATEAMISYHHHRGVARMRREGMSRPAKINLGAGDACKAGFLNVDLFPGGDLTLDLRRGLPFESNSCELIFSEHFFEHLNYPEEITLLMRDCLRVLRPGGVLSFSVPDTEWPLSDYERGLDSPYFKACEEHRWHPDCTTRLEHINFHFRQHGQHLYAYDEETMRKVLESVGFVNVKKRDYQPELDSGRRRVGSLFMQAEKPN